MAEVVERRKMARAHELIVQALEEGGVDHVFGIPGGGTGQIFGSLYGNEGRVRTILTRHEQAAAIMADAYGRATGKPAAIMGQGVFMGSNATFGIMEAFLSSSPMIVLTDTSDGGSAQHPANQSGAGEYGSVDLLNIFRSMTKYTTLATTPKEAVLGTQLAIKHAASGRPGPTCVLMRSASIVGEVDMESPPFIHHTAGYLNTSAPQASPQDIQRAIELLSGASKPVLVAGNGVHMAQAHDLLRELAELWGMPVATSYKGKSVIEETHPLAVGMVGVYGQTAANTVVGEADAVLVVGARLSTQDTIRERPQVFDPRRQRIIQVDIDPRNTGWTFPVDLGLVGDAAAILSQLVEASRPLASVNQERARQRVQGLQSQKASLDYYHDPALLRDSSPVLPQRVVRILQETLDPSALITLDAGNNRVWMCHFYQSQQKGTFFCPGGMAGMGWSLPASLALKLVHPDRPVVSVTGDGGFMMSVHALSTAIQYDLPIVCVVMNDSALGMVRHHQGSRTIASEFVQTDHGAVARGFGAYGVQVQDSRDLADALREALASGRPAVVDVVIDREPNPDDVRADLRSATET